MIGEAEEIEVTPEMIAAGDAAYALFDGHDPLEWILPAIYRAMESVRRRQAAIVQEDEFRQDMMLYGRVVFDIVTGKIVPPDTFYIDPPR